MDSFHAILIIFSPIMQNDLLTFEKMESGLMDLRKEMVAPISVVRDSIQIFVLQAKSKNVKLELVTSGKSFFSSRIPTTAPVIF